LFAGCDWGVLSALEGDEGVAEVCAAAGTSKPPKRIAVFIHDRYCIAPSCLIVENFSCIDIRYEYIVGLLRSRPGCDGRYDE
jgi:hypothetical protein